MGLDFSRLNSLNGNTGQGAEQKPTETTETPVEATETIKATEVLPKGRTPVEANTDATEAEGIPQEGKVYNKLQIEADRQGEEVERAKAVYGKYQDAIRASESQMTVIMKAVNAGETDYKTLFLKACEVVSLTTSNSVFYNHIKRVVQ